MILRRADADAIVEAARRLVDGEVVALPTETVYGLGADAASARGVAAIYRIKGRPDDHPLIVHVLDAEQAAWWGELGERGRRLVEAFWPGPLTVIVRRRVDAPAFACAGESTVGLRSPSHPVARALLVAFTRLGGHGIAAPSANRFGRVSPTRAQHVADDLGDDVGMILDGGPCAVGVESTIIDLSRDVPVLLRPGGIPADRLESVLGVAPRPRDAAAPRASGTLAAHYAPHTPVELVETAMLAARVDDLVRAGGRIGVWSRDLPELAAGLSADAMRWEPAPEDPQAYARVLYDTLRMLDREMLTRLLVERVPDDDDAWHAVSDRLGRAAATFAGR